MKTTLPTKITTEEQAKSFLLQLIQNDEISHPSDDYTNMSGDNFSHDEGLKMNDLMQDIYEIENLSFDPCEFILMQDPEYVKMLNNEK